MEPTFPSWPVQAPGFQQREGGVPVLGAQYLVHLAGDGPAQHVESVGGRYFTGLTAPTTPTVPDEVLRAAALGALPDAARAQATAQDAGLVILPGGAGRLTRHYTVRATDADGTPLTREAYVDANAGVVALAHDARTPSAAAAPAEAVAPSAVAPDSAPATVTPATGTAPDVRGMTTDVDIGCLADAVTSSPTWSSGSGT